MKGENALLRRYLPTRSPAMRQLVRVAERVASLPSTLLLTGETGSGKDYLAEAIHRASSRHAAPFMRIDCGAIPRELFESELFGHEKGAFTDARHTRAGRLELANGGTVYLDEIPALEPDIQPKLLRLLQERRFSRIGGTKSIEIDVRFIASSTLGVEQLASGEQVRSDLFYRLNVVSMALPPLRERPEDLPMLSRRFLVEAAERLQRNVRELEPEALGLLAAHDWPGNLRELRNAIERAVLLSDDETLRAEHLPPALSQSGEHAVAAALPAMWTLQQLEHAYIVRVLARTGGNSTAAARILGINRKTLLEKKKRYGIEWDERGTE